MSKSRTYFDILSKLNKKNKLPIHVAIDLSTLFTFTKADATYPYNNGNSVFPDVVADLRGRKINKRQKLSDVETIFGVYLDYITPDKKSAIGTTLHGIRNLKNLITDISPDTITKDEGPLYWFNSITDTNELLVVEYTWNAGTSKYVKGADFKIAARSFFIADLIWLYYHEEMGIFKILGKLMDDVYRNGSYPVPHDSVAGEMIQANIQQFRAGLASTLSDRESSYRRCLGWQSDEGAKLDLKSTLNENFKTAFHAFIQTALEYYNEKRLISSIQSINPAGPQAAINTIMSVRDAIETLRQSFDVFQHGRNVYHTAQGVLNVIAGFFLIYHTREYIGVPRNGFESPEDFIPEAIKRLNVSVAAGNNSNRYIIHRNAAEYGRDLLLDLEFFDNYSDTNALKIWLDSVEDKVESYRSAYRQIKGVDLAPKTIKATAPY